MKISTRLLSIMTALILSIGLDSCEVHIDDDGINVSLISSGLEYNSWKSVTDYEDCTITRMLTFRTGNTGTYTEIIDNYDSYGRYTYSTKDYYNFTWKVDDSYNMTLYLDNGSNIYFDNVAIVSGKLSGWFNSEKLYFDSY